MLFDLRQAFHFSRAYAPPPRATLRDDDLLTPDDVARMMGMSKRWVYESFSIPAKGGIKPIKLGGAPTSPVRWYAWEVKAWIATRHREAGRP